MDPITPIAIVTLAFTKVFETTIEKFTEAALTKVDQLRNKLWDKLRGNPKAEVALQAVENGSKADIEKVAAYLQVEMNEDDSFAQEIKGLAKEIQSLKIQDNSNMTMNVYDNAKGWQTKVEGGTAYIGEIHIHDKQH